MENVYTKSFPVKSNGVDELQIMAHAFVPLCTHLKPSIQESLSPDSSVVSKVTAVSSSDFALVSSSVSDSVISSA